MKRILKYLLLFGLIVLFIWTMFFLYQKSASRPDEFAIEKPKKNNVIKKTVANGKITEHWDVMQEEVPAAQSVNGNSMFTGPQG